MEEGFQESYVVSDILADDVRGNPGLTIARYHILKSFDMQPRFTFLELLEIVKVPRARLNNDLNWLITRHLIQKESYKKNETHFISEKGKFLLILLQEYENGAEAAEVNQSIILPLIERLRSTSIPMAKYLEEYAKEYETIGSHLQQKARLIRESIRKEEFQEK